MSRLANTERARVAILDRIVGRPGLTLAQKNAALAEFGNEFTNTTRPRAATFARGTRIWNSDDNQTQFSDETNWRNPDGIIT